MTSLPTNRPSDRAAVFSTTHRYAVVGCPAAQGLQIAQWAENVEERLARFLATPIPAGDPIPVTIYLSENPALGRGRVLKAQAFNAGLFDQRIEMVNPRLADQEDLLEGLCWLLLNRMLVARQPMAARTNEPPRVPEWLATGAAQNLFPEARQRNVRTVVDDWKNGRSHGMDEILGWQFMPEGRWNQKAEVGLFVEFLLPAPLAAKRLASLLARIESGDSIDADFVAKRVLFQSSAAAAEKARDVWLAQQQNVQVELGGISPERVASLVQMLEIRPSDYGFMESDKIPPVVDLKDLIRRRNDEWVRQLAGRVSMKMKLLSVGQAPEFQRVIAGYAGFLDAVGVQKRGFTGGLFGRGASAGALQKLLDQAERQFIEFQVAQKQRQQFVEKAVRAGSEPPPPPDAIRSYLDQLEQKR